jgi:hypothetical protein
VAGGVDVHPWLTFSERFLADHRLDTVASVECRVGPLEGLVPAPALDAFRACAPEDAEDLRVLLRDPRHRLLVKLLIFVTEAVPEPLLEDAVRAGVMTNNPSFNKHFIFPCAIVYGRRAVVRSLLDVFTRGTDREKYGVAGALYWCSMPREHMYWPHEDGGARRPAQDDPIDDLIRTFEDRALEEFVENPALDVRRALVSALPGAARRAPALGAQAIAIAREHPDAYVRRRVLCDLGESPLFPCKPLPSG